jgi:hypothetical protein
VEAGRVSFWVTVDAGRVTGYELITVEAGWTEVSMRVVVCWGKVEMMVL